jgi:diguanylate cyclase (GGDEF)-like protein
LFATGQVQTNIAYRVSDSEMIWHWHTSNASPIRSKSGRVTGFEGVAKDITVQRALEEEVRQLAFYDPLTKLPNRRLLDDRLSQTLVSSKRSACYGALVFLDLDKFKELNDTYGHAVGDLLLIEVSRRLTACVRKIDTVARFGGDEFVILLGELNRDKIESNSLARVIAEKIRVSLAEPYHLAAPLNGAGAGIIEHHCTASIGIVVFVSDQIAVADILKWADAAMYQAKVAGRNTIRAFEVASASSQVEVEMHKSRTMSETYAQI